ncbi:MAG: hypothetical protein M3068_12965 [Gemmatimonadota bacterium]|nr:hypothetical protein [Gemmatimonadota bacterium]
MTTSRSRTLLGALAMIAATPLVAVAQQSDTTQKPPAVPPAPAPKPAATAKTPNLDFSGVILGNYQYKTDSASKAQNGTTNPNKFDIERVYLTFQMPAGDNASIRATTDIFQQTSATTNGFYRGWVVRLKYGYLQYNFLRSTDGNAATAFGRIGMLHNVVIDHEETFWPRYLSQTAVERFGFFSSSDLGAAAQLNLPNKMGQLYGTVTNGPGYTAAETDRFKDLALRASFTPLGSQDGFLKTLTISPWIYKGYTASKFATGGTGQVGPVTDGLARDRYGIFAGLKDRRLTAGAELAQRKEGYETGSNTSVSPRAANDSTGRLVDAFLIARPLEWMNAAEKSSVGIVVRYDHFTPNTSTGNSLNSSAYQGSTPSYNLLIAGVFWEPTARTALALDLQRQSPTSFPNPGSGVITPTPTQSTVFLHWTASF